MKRKGFPFETIKRLAQQVAPENRVARKAVLRLNLVLVDTITQVMRDAKKFADHTKRKTITEDDVIAATT